MADRLHRLIPSLATVFKGHQNGLATFAIEQGIIVHAFGNLHTINLLDDAACLHFRLTLIERTAFHDLGNLETIALVIKVKQHTKLCRGIAFAPRPVARSCVRNIQLAQNLAQHLGEVVVVVDMCQERLISLFHQCQIHAMMVFHEETLLDLQEDMFKHVFAFLSKVELHSGVMFNRSGLAALIKFLQVVA